MLAPSSAARRHFRNSGLPLRPSLQRWLHVKQTCLKETPLFTFHRKKNGYYSLLNLFLMASPCFVSYSTFHLSRGHFSHPVPVLHCNQGSYCLKCSAHQQHGLYSMFCLTIGCNHLTQNSGKWVSGNVIPNHLLLRPKLQLLQLPLRTRVPWLLFKH